jgi:hypothetical protein
MPLKQAIKAKIYLGAMIPGYPLQEFVEWAEGIEKNVLLHYLDEIQCELEGELFLAVSDNSIKEQGSLQTRHSLYCAQVRKYYQAIVRNPCCRSALSFLLSNSLPDRPQR